jgi:hypothetical protein
MKGPIIAIVLVVGIFVLGATAILFVLNPASRADAPAEAQRAPLSGGKGRTEQFHPSTGVQLSQRN